MNHRLAVYYAPDPLHPLWHAGCDWLGRDPLSSLARMPTREHVSAPWRYGFHATLKAPMRLAEGRTEADFQGAVAEVAASHPRFEMPTMSVQWLGDFLALRAVEPLAPAHPLHRLADACVTRLDVWRAPPTQPEMERRLAQQLLDENETDLLRTYGYPHVLSHWRFHMTLTDSLPADEALRADLLRAAQQHFAAALAQPLACDAVSLYAEPLAGQPLVLLKRMPLA